MLKRVCKKCGDDITARAKLVPSAILCVDCQEAAGDVFRYRGYRDPCTPSGKHLGGVERIIRSPDEDTTDRVEFDSLPEDDDG